MSIDEEQTRRVEEDLWGRICRDYHETGDAKYVIRRDDDHKDPTDPAFSFRTDLLSQEVEALQRAKGHVLDIGCGVGADVLWLQEQGMKVTGIDFSSGAIEVARKRGCQDVHVLSFWDVASFGTRFDTFLLMGNGMGLAGTVEKTNAFLELLSRTASDGAILIGHTVDPTATKEGCHLAYQRQNEAEGRYRGQVRIREEYKGRVTPWWNLVFFEPKCLARVCGEHGWETEEIIEWDPSYFVIARKRQ